MDYKSGQELQIGAKGITKSGQRLQIGAEQPIVTRSNENNDK